jgi:ATP/maltotriose-dependent transcriptional regulator MalT
VLARALTACGLITTLVSAEAARPYFAEAIGLARELDDRWRLSQILVLQAVAAQNAGDPIATRAFAEEGRDLADAIGARYDSRTCRFCLGLARAIQGDLDGAAAQFAQLVPEAEAAHDVLLEANSLASQGAVLAFQGDTGAARAAADAAIEVATELGGIYAAMGYAALAFAALAADDAATVQEATKAWPHLSALFQTAASRRVFGAEAALALGDLGAARQWADDAVRTATGWYLSRALTISARVAIAQGDRNLAERHAYDALARAAEVEAYLVVPDILEILATSAVDSGSHLEAARLFGAAHGIRERMGAVRLKVYDAGYEAAVAPLREAMGQAGFEAACTEGAALSTEEAIAYAQRGRGERKRPTTGWASLTPAERDVVRLVSAGLGNNDIATRLFVSPRTVQSHLTHVYSKLGLNSRNQHIQEAARHA